ncbi:hypothetical protein D3C81_1255370 [compost metagenome]
MLPPDLYGSVFSPVSACISRASSNMSPAVRPCIAASLKLATLLFTALVMLSLYLPIKPVAKSFTLDDAAPNSFSRNRCPLCSDKLDLTNSGRPVFFTMSASWVLVSLAEALCNSKVSRKVKYWRN